MNWGGLAVFGVWGDYKEHVETVIGYFKDETSADNVARVAKDPVRKLNSVDRLIAPARLILKNGKTPHAFAIGIAAAILYDNEDDQESRSVQKMRHREGDDTVLREVCGLDFEKDARLIELIKQKIEFEKSKQELCASFSEGRLDDVVQVSAKIPKNVELVIWDFDNVVGNTTQYYAQATAVVYWRIKNGRRNRSPKEEDDPAFKNDRVYQNGIKLYEKYHPGRATYLTLKEALEESGRRDLTTDDCYRMFEEERERIFSSLTPAEFFNPHMRELLYEVRALNPDVVFHVNTALHDEFFEKQFKKRGFKGYFTSWQALTREQRKDDNINENKVRNLLAFAEASGVDPNRIIIIDDSPSFFRTLDDRLPDAHKVGVAVSAESGRSLIDEGVDAVIMNLKPTSDKLRAFGIDESGADDIELLAPDVYSIRAVPERDNTEDGDQRAVEDFRQKAFENTPYFVETYRQRRHAEDDFEALVRAGEIRPNVIINIKNFSPNAVSVYMAKLMEVSALYNGNLRFLLVVEEDTERLQNDLPSTLNAINRAREVLGDDFCAEYTMMIADAGRNMRGMPLTLKYVYEGLMPFSKERLENGKTRERLRFHEIFIRTGGLMLQVPGLGRDTCPIVSSDAVFISENIKHPGGADISIPLVGKKLMVPAVSLDPEKEDVSGKIVAAIHESRHPMFVLAKPDVNLFHRFLNTYEDYGAPSFRNLHFFTLWDKEFLLRFAQEMEDTKMEDGKPLADIPADMFLSIFQSVSMPRSEWLECIPRGLSDGRQITESDWLKMREIAIRFFGLRYEAVDFAEATSPHSFTDEGTLRKIATRFRGFVRIYENAVKASPDVRIINDPTSHLDRVVIKGNGTVRFGKMVQLSNVVIELDGEVLEIPDNWTIQNAYLRGNCRFDTSTKKGGYAIGAVFSDDETGDLIPLDGIIFRRNTVSTVVETIDRTQIIVQIPVDTNKDTLTRMSFGSYGLMELQESVDIVSDMKRTGKMKSFVDEEFATMPNIFPLDKDAVDQSAVDQSVVKKMSYSDMTGIMVERVFHEHNERGGGKYWVRIEGIQGSGKTHLANVLKSELEALGKHVVVMDEDWFHKSRKTREAQRQIKTGMERRKWERHFSNWHRWDVLKEAISRINNDPPGEIMLEGLYRRDDLMQDGKVVLGHEGGTLTRGAVLNITADTIIIYSGFYSSDGTKAEIPSDLSIYMGISLRDSLAIKTRRDTSWGRTSEDITVLHKTVYSPAFQRYLRTHDPAASADKVVRIDDIDNFSEVSIVTPLTRKRYYEENPQEEGVQPITQKGLLITSLGTFLSFLGLSYITHFAQDITALPIFIGVLAGYLFSMSIISIVTRQFIVRALGERAGPEPRVASRLGRGVNPIAWTINGQIIRNPAFDNLPGIIQKFILLHEETHVVGYGELMAYVFPWIGQADKVLKHIKYNFNQYKNYFALHPIAGQLIIRTSLGLLALLAFNTLSIGLGVDVGVEPYCAVAMLTPFIPLDGIITFEIVKDTLVSIRKNLVVVEDPAMRHIRIAVDKVLEHPETFDISEYIGLLAQYNKYMDGEPRQRMATAALGLEDRERISYFSLEYGLSEWLNIYGGGLGVLSGDTLWGASDRYARNTFVAVGLAYHTGYFEQHIVTEEDHTKGMWPDSPVGGQVELYKEIDFEKYGEIVKDENDNDLVIKVEANKTEVKLGNFIYAKVWRIKVGRVELYLLDTDIDENDIEEDARKDLKIRDLTHNLYAKGRDANHEFLASDKDEWRFMQELLLGIGGVRALNAMGIKIATLHMNEGHSALAGLELIRHNLEKRAADIGFTVAELNELVHRSAIDADTLERAGVTFEKALEDVKEHVIFTTHTPVEAGNEQFDPSVIMPYLINYAESNGLSIGDVERICIHDRASDGKPMLNMSLLALELARDANAVSKKHAKVSQELYGNDAIGYITNAVHRRFWQAVEIQQLLQTRLQDISRQNIGKISEGKMLDDLDEDELKVLLEHVEDDEIIEISRSIKRKAVKHLEEIRNVKLDEDAFTIVISRRVAAYKRLDLIVPLIQRLVERGRDAGIKIQIVFAGKAHPSDNASKPIIERLNRLAKEYPGVVFFVENFNIAVAKDLTKIASVWLNNPIPPMEASGTSGMKSGINGAISVSTPDGWVLEAAGAYNWESGAITGVDDIEGAAVLFEEAETEDGTRENMYAVLSRLIEIYTIDESKWAQMTRNVMWDSMSHFSTVRMIKEYEEFWKPKIEVEKAAITTKGLLITSLGTFLSFLGLSYLTYLAQDVTALPILLGVLAGYLFTMSNISIITRQFIVRALGERGSPISKTITLPNGAKQIQYLKEDGTYTANIEEALIYATQYGTIRKKIAIWLIKSHENTHLYGRGILSSEVAAYVAPWIGKIQIQKDTDFPKLLFAIAILDLTVGNLIRLFANTIRFFIKLLARIITISTFRIKGMSNFEMYYNSGRGRFTISPNGERNACEEGRAFTSKEQAVVMKALLRSTLESIDEATDASIEIQDLLHEIARLDIGDPEQCLVQADHIMAELAKRLGVHVGVTNSQSELVSNLSRDAIGRLNNFDYQGWKRKVAEELESQHEHFENKDYKIFSGIEYCKVTLFDKKDTVEKILPQYRGGTVVASGDSAVDISFLSMHPDGIDYRPYYVGEAQDVQQFPSVNTSYAGMHEAGSYEAIRNAVKEHEKGMIELKAIVADIDGCMIPLDRLIKFKTAILLRRALLMGVKVHFITGGHIKRRIYLKVVDRISSPIVFVAAVMLNFVSYLQNKIGNKSSKKDKILFCIPSTVAKEDTENGRKLIQRVAVSNDQIPEDVETVFFEDRGSDEANMSYVTSLAQRYGAMLALPVQREGLSVNTIEQVLSRGFLEETSKDLFKLLNPDLAELDQTRASFMNNNDLQRLVGIRLAQILPPMASENLSILSLYDMNIRLSNIARKTMLEKLTQETRGHLKNDKEKKAVSIRVSTIGEAKIQAEAFRARMNQIRRANKEADPIFLELRISPRTFEESQALERLNTVELGRLMNIDDMMAQGILALITEEASSELSVADIASSLTATGLGYKKGNIVIVDMKDAEKNKEFHELPEGIVIIQYSGFAEGSIFDRALELMVHRDKRRAGISARKPYGLRLFFILPSAEHIDMNQLKRELDYYRKEVLTRA